MSLRVMGCCVVCNKKRIPATFPACGYVVLPTGEHVLMSWCPEHDHHALNSDEVMELHHGKQWTGPVEERGQL